MSGKPSVDQRQKDSSTVFIETNLNDRARQVRGSNHIGEQVKETEWRGLVNQQQMETHCHTLSVVVVGPVWEGVTAYLGYLGIHRAYYMCIKETLARVE